MSSFQLPLPAPTADAPSPQSRLPIHVSFSPSQDILVALWETGYLELTDLRTRIGPGRGKVMDPLPLWRGLAGETVLEHRQILSLAHVEGALKVVVLGTSLEEESSDIATLLSITEGVVERTSVKLPQRNGRLIPSDEHIWWQSPSGEIQKGRWLPIDLSPYH